MNQSKRVYLKHRLGFAIFITILTFLIIIFFESNFREIVIATPSLFFWIGSSLLLSVPLIGGLSLKDSLKFFAYSLPLFFLFGLFALIIPTHLLTRSISILAIIWILVLTFLIRRKPEVFDLKPRISPLTFLETIVIWGLSSLCSHLIRSFKLMDTVIVSISPLTNYLLLMLMFYIAFSIVTIASRSLIKRHKQLAS